jgi:ribosome-associated heat shock protein Hsp15
MDEVRLDQWLCAARIFKSRTLAQKACQAGHLTVNEVVAKSSRTVRVGDRLLIRSPRGQRVLTILGIRSKRVAAPLARELYDDLSPVPTTSESIYALRPKGAGRPTKAERRSLLRWRQDVDLE